MVQKGLLVRLEIKPGKDAEAEEFLRSALPLVGQEADTTAWFAIRFGRSEYGIFDVFPDDAARDAHLNGAVAAALKQKANELFTEAPNIQKVDVLAHKLPATAPAQPDTKAILLTFKAKKEHESEVAGFLKKAQPMAQEEVDTISWFAIRLENGEYGIFDTFPDNGDRFKHLIGQIPREMAAHAFSLLGSVPDLELLNVISEKLGS
jgi:quinol monooxygenase YgiN